MNRDQIERAEAIVAKLLNHDEAVNRFRAIERRIIAAEEARGYKKPKSLAQPKVKPDYQFTEEQLLIAARSLARKG
jgi:hypothetical protein